ncbi:cell division protein FtsK [Alphaproteobacteria bacterium HT1-32]|nr:cell division protein FtsK [Alphaproteobacteria bacterium HT1-32]
MAQSKAGRPAFLPADLSEFLKRRLREARGLLLALMGAALLAALFSYKPTDPSINVAVAGPVQNWAGLPGALFADISLQLIGIAALLPGFCLIAWGLRIMRGGTIVWPWIRGFSLLLAMLFMTLAASALDMFSGWQLVSGPGGAIGAGLMQGADAVTARIGGAVGLVGVGLVALVVAAGITLFAAAIASRDLAGAGRATLKAGRVAGAAGAKAPAIGRTLLSWLPKRRPQRVEPRMQRDTSLARPPVRPSKTREAEPVMQAEADAEVRRERKPVVAQKPERPETGNREKASRQKKLDFGVDGEFELPPLDLLTEAPPAIMDPSQSDDALQQNARMLESVLQDFGVNGEIVKVNPGPVVTLYELEPAPGTKTSRVIGLADDIARSMSAISVRIATIPGRSVIGIELPNRKRETVYLHELLAARSYEKSSARLLMALGKDIGGLPEFADLARMPHLLIAGTTGSGKSVGINAMILSLLYRCTPDECRMIMIDPKMLELSVYDGIPHLLSPVVTDPSKAVVALKWAVREMEDRYRAMSQLSVRNIAGFNERLAKARENNEELKRTVQTGFDQDTGKPIFEEQAMDLEPLPYIVIVVDEMADLMLVAGKDVEAAIQRLAQMARAAGIHLIMATQRPSVDVITGTIKANFPTRISFQVTSKIDSRTILGEQGAEQLLGQGDMLHMAGGGRITRLHGPFVSDEEVNAIVDHLKSQGSPAYLESVTEEDADAPAFPGMPAPEGKSSGDDLYDQAVALVCREGKASTSFVQRHLQIGYNRAARIIEQMEKEGVVSKSNHVGKREVLARNFEADYDEAM